MDAHKESTINIHATAVLFQSKGLLIRGEPGSGKSDLALRLIDAGGQLIADDRCVLSLNSSDKVQATAPENLAGLLEVRGLGLISLPYVKAAEIDLTIDLVKEPKLIPRLPSDKERQNVLLGQALQKIQLWPFADSAIPVIKMALATPFP